MPCHLVIRLLFRENAAVLRVTSIHTHIKSKHYILYILYLYIYIYITYNIYIYYKISIYPSSPLVSELLTWTSGFSPLPPMTRSCSPISTSMGFRKDNSWPMEEQKWLGDTWSRFRHISLDRYRRYVGGSFSIFSRIWLKNVEDVEDRNTWNILKPRS